MKKTIKSKLRRLLGMGDKSVSDLGLFYGKDRLVGLRVKPYGRMGNNLLQISNAILLARALGLNHVQMPQTQFLNLPEPVTMHGLTLLPPEQDIKDLGGFITSGFFRETRLEPIGATMELRRQVIQRYIVPHLTIQTKPSERKDCLAVHLRSGDVFGDRPHPSYVQPPLAFYKHVIEDARERLGITRVLLVFEDRKNPCVDSLEKYVVQSGLTLEMQSGTFLEDVSALMSAKNLAFGYGTFGIGICLMSSVSEAVYVFGTSGFPYSKLDTIKHLHVYEDVSGTYPQPGEWTASRQQRDLMVSLPASAVKLVEEVSPTQQGADMWWTNLDTQI